MDECENYDGRRVYKDRVSCWGIVRGAEEAKEGFEFFKGRE